ncbi:MAG: twin-arginine translocation signal domain-containing protein, partial [Candidatus Hydrogenedentes bacterium]|nr:twin-arginine translocation signal domain-containing protein [Candidatus Hydrogenedentota bacterium]
MNPIERFQLEQTRRQFLGRAATGIGTVALANLLNPRLLAETIDDVWRGITNPPHGIPKAKRV